MHFFQNTPGTAREQAQTGCLRLLHLVDLYRVRRTVTDVPRPVSHVDNGNAKEDWWWPARMLEKGAHDLIPSSAGKQYKSSANRSQSADVQRRKRLRKVL